MKTDKLTRKLLVIGILAAVVMIVKNRVLAR